MWNYWMYVLSIFQVTPSVFTSSTPWEAQRQNTITCTGTHAITAWSLELIRRGEFCVSPSQSSSLTQTVCKPDGELSQNACSITLYIHTGVHTIHKISSLFMFHLMERIFLMLFSYLKAQISIIGRSLF